MLKDELLKKVDTLEREDQLNFFIGTLSVTNRFDVYDIHQFEEGDAVTDVSFILYSLIANAIFFKAQEKQVVQQGFLLYQKQFASFKGSDTALPVLEKFLYNTEKITLPVFVDALLSLAIHIEKKRIDQKHLTKLITKNKEIVLNQVTLFLRSLNHTYLSNNIDPKKIAPDYDDLTNGIFLYDKKDLIIPTWQNAFTMNGFRRVCIIGIKKLTNALDFSSIESITVLYFSKDIGTKFVF